MYPFEQFSERAKKALTLAQAESESAGHRYIGTEHLLLALLREGEGLAAIALGNLAVDIDKVRATLENVLGRNQRIVIPQIVPTSRVKRVIELSFEEARRMGRQYVGTEHMLLGLLIEGESIAAHVLKDLGVTLPKARQEIEKVLRERGPETEGLAPETVRRAMAQQLAGYWEMQLRSAAQGEAPAGLDHLLRSLIETGGTEALARLLDVQQATAAKEQAIVARDYDAATQRRAEEQQARRALEQAIAEWAARLGPSTEAAS